MTVPSNPISGHRLTRVAIMARLASILSDMRETIVSRIFLAFQERRSDRDAQASNATCLSPFKPPLKYHNRSKIRVHMAKVRMAMRISTLPPWFRKALMAADASIIAVMVDLLLAFGVFGDNTSGLFIQHMDDALGTAVNDGVQQYSRNGYNQTLYSRHQRLRDTAGHVFRIAGTEDGDCLERQNHTDHCTQQAHQGCYGGDNFQQCQTAFDGWTLFQNCLFKLQIQRLRVDPFVLFRHLQNTAQRVVRVRRTGLQLSAHLAVNTNQVHDTPDTQQEAKDTHGGDHVTHTTTLMPALYQCGAVDQGCQQGAASGAGRVNTHLHQTGVGRLQSGRRSADGTTRLTRQFFNFSGRRVVGQILAVGHQVIGTNTDHVLGGALAVGLDHLSGEANNTTGLYDFLLHFKPQALDFSDSRQTGVAVHLIDQVGQELTAIGKLNTHQ